MQKPLARSATGDSFHIDCSLSSAPVSAFRRRDVGTSPRAAAGRSADVRGFRRSYHTLHTPLLV